MQMLSLRGKVFLAAHEAIVLRRYRDIKRIWTIAVGVTAAARASINPETFHGDITVRHAIDLMIAILPQYEKEARQAAGGRTLPQHQFDALVSLAYNVGDIGPTARRLIARGQVGAAIDLYRADERRLEAEKKGNGEGMKLRRDAEVRLAKTGDYGKKKIRVMSATRGGVPFDLYKLSQDELLAQLTPDLPREHRRAGSPRTGWVSV